MWARHWDDVFETGTTAARIRKNRGVSPLVTSVFPSPLPTMRQKRSGERGFNASHGNSKCLVIKLVEQSAAQDSRKGSLPAPRAMTGQ